MNKITSRVILKTRKIYEEYICDAYSLLMDTLSNEKNSSFFVKKC